MDICEDFLVFCKAAVSRKHSKRPPKMQRRTHLCDACARVPQVDVKHLPVEFRSSQSSSSPASSLSSSTSGAAPTAAWDWGEFLSVASKRLMFAVEKPDIVAEWGNAIPFRLSVRICLT